MFRKDMLTHRLTRIGILVAFSMIISLLEQPILSFLPIPIPGFKLGLSNIVLLYCTYARLKKDAVYVLLLRCFLTALLFGNIYSLALSLSGGILALIGMLALSKLTFLSPIGTSVFSASLHVSGQVTCAAVILHSAALFVNYLPYLLILSIVGGIFTGSVVIILIKRKQVFTKKNDS